MALSVPVLVRGVSDLSSARYAAGMSVDYIAFDESAKDLIQSIKPWLSGPRIGLECQSVQACFAYQNLLDFCILENQTSNFPAFAHSSDFWFKIDMTYAPENLPAPNTNIIASIAPDAIEKQTFLIHTLAGTNIVWLETDFLSTSKSIQELIELTGCHGICLVAQSETEVGMANVEHLAQILEPLEKE